MKVNSSLWTLKGQSRHVMNNFETKLENLYMNWMFLKINYQNFTKRRKGILNGFIVVI